MKNYNIYLIRNGLIEENKEGKYIGHTDVSLSDEGKNQIINLKEQYEYPDVDVVFSSPLKRCLETANIIYPDKNPLVIRELIEYDFGEFEGLTADDLAGYEEFKSWISGGEDSAPPNGESNAAFAKRIREGFSIIIEGLMKTGITSAAIVTHGGVIMGIMSAFGIPEAPMHEWIMPNGCGYQLRVDPMLWMRGEKAEAIAEIPLVLSDEKDDYKMDYDSYSEYDDDTDWENDELFPDLKIEED